MLRITSAIAALVLAALVMTGCGGRSDAETPPSATSDLPAIAPADGETVAGEAYGFTLPQGWGFPDGAPDTFDETTFAAFLDDQDDFADNLNIITSPAGEVSPEQVESVGVDELEGAGATDVTVLDRVTAAGQETAHLTAGFEQDGVEYQIDQYYLTDAGQTYIVTFSFSPDVSQEDRDQIAQSVLATWQWR
ncbi:hypothetical protein KZX37_00680 [Microbacterium sp. EYE_5]|uniref:hypothetical protein n=1 Tax=unclassified Microbacterium TaxID=2609290 RepID=UPI0020030978|nr:MULTISPECIES: hypothetical protein [unclassified Microbacterium]MCK6079129.1 hypothetical protein [Microbacterium sp. EYE_382]MCK6084399.1 hypothetical protein [Microbacterium sp. EYE_384]MCK6123372.1 hypothetical protein [Microbacterium sp. EYE_80]MCK6125163.1 hypothetical protein [Microbacterium sp. EYE_79]MCK6140083.1 hypothetical protein [Microbacterium sp. EYE_39]